MNSSRFKISKEESQQCSAIAIWKTLLEFDENKSSFLSYLKKRIRWEVLDFIDSEQNKEVAYKHDSYNPCFLIDFFDGLSQDEIDLLMYRFYFNYTVKEISQKISLSPHHIIKKIENTVKKLI